MDVARGISCNNDTLGPASINKTVCALFSAKREAIAIPAVPPPTKKYVIATLQHETLNII